MCLLKQQEKNSKNCLGKQPAPTRMSVVILRRNNERLFQTRLAYPHPSVSSIFQDSGRANRRRIHRSGNQIRLLCRPGDPFSDEWQSNIPRSIYESSNVTLRLSGDFYILVWFSFLCVEVSSGNCETMQL